MLSNVRVYRDLLGFENTPHATGGDPVEGLPEGEI